MSHSRNRRRIHRNSSARSPHRERRLRALRRLGAEPLEKRILLTTVSSVDPLANTHDVAVSTNVSATFDEAINAATATPQNFAVHSDMRAGTVAVSAAGMTVTADPSSDFFPGELVRVTATAGIQGTATANTSRAWQFRTEVTSGSGQFADGGTAFGSPTTPQMSSAIALR